MSDVRLEDGEFTEIIDNEDANRSYAVEVLDNDVRVTHDRSTANRGEGQTLHRRATHRLSNLRGKRLFAVAHDGPTRLRITPAGADVHTQPSHDVTVVEGNIEVDGNIDVSDRAAREAGKIRVQNSDGTLVDPATDETVSSELPRRIDAWNAGTIGVDTGLGTVRQIDAWNAGTIGVDTGLGTARQIDAWNAGTLDVAAAPSNQPIHDSTTATGSANAATLEIGVRQSVDVMYDLTGPATVTVEVSPDGAAWYQREQIDTDGVGSILISSAFEHVRTYADSNLNELLIGAKA